MRIEHLHLKNFRNFANWGTDFVPGFNVLIGDNGTGKTAILEALKIGLGTVRFNFLNDRPELIEKEDIRLVTRGTTEQPTLEAVYPVVISLTGTLDEEQHSWTREISEARTRVNKGNSRTLGRSIRQRVQQITSDTPPVLPIIAYYSSRRLWSQKINFHPESRQSGHSKRLGETLDMGQLASRLEAYRNALNPLMNQRAIRYWFLRLQLSEMQRGETNRTLETVRQAVISMYPEWQKIYFDLLLSELVVQFEDGHILPTKLLSDGQRNMLSLVADLAYRCAQLNPELREQALVNTPGVVLIDELDLHLHPKWQQRVVNDLRRTFPQVQFIATTHSPLIVQSLRSGELTDLNTGKSASNANLTGGTPEDYFQQSVEEILVDEMGLKETRRNKEYQEMMQVAEEYYQLLESEAIDTERAAWLKQRLDELTLPFHSNPAYVAYRSFLEQQRLVVVGDCA